VGGAAEATFLMVGDRHPHGTRYAVFTGGVRIIANSELLTAGNPTV